MKFDKNSIILISVAVVLVIVLAVLMIIALGDLADRKTEQPLGTTAPTVATEPGEDQVVQTPYGKMVFPGQWASYLHIERVDEPELEVSYIAKLPSGKVQPLFDVRFGEALDPAVGQVVTGEGVAVGVHATVHPFEPDGSWSVVEAELIPQMMECLTQVLDGLNMVPLGSPIPELNGDEMGIDTPYCELWYPSHWLEELRISMDETDGYEVVFSGVVGDHDPVQLFAVNFGGSESRGQAVHSVLTENNVPIVVRVRTFNLELTDWGAVDQSTIMAMQEDLNHLLAKLTEE